MRVFFDIYMRLKDSRPRLVGRVCAYQSPQGVVVNKVPGVRFEPGREAVRGVLPLRYRQCFRRGSRIQFAPTPYADGWQAFQLVTAKGNVAGVVWAIPSIEGGI